MSHPQRTEAATAGLSAWDSDPGLARDLDSTARWALRYAELGWGVFPLAPGSNVPLADSSGVSDATTDPDLIRSWWPPGSRFNIGATPPPGHLVLDLDKRDDGRDGAATLRALDLSVPATARQRTPHGTHHVFQLPPGVELRQTAGKVAPGVDTRRHRAGYIAVEPSVRPSGSYVWEVAPVPGNIAEAPEWLVERLTCDRSQVRDWRELAGATVPSGARNATLASVAGLLYRRLPAELAYDLGMLWAQHRCDPPLPEREAQRTLSSIATCELRRRGAA
ncbi:MAG TPA: bifunctional DNA primase/polymerase [Thermoanaerobaculia bacterium]|nr:bifunctional DNA primase/polymerase [Thermoanaerobaculia bacterium]